MKKNSKQNKVREYLLNGNSISQWAAIELFRATRLSAIIFNLREEGLPIASRWMTSSSGDARYKEYYIQETK